MKFTAAFFRPATLATLGLRGLVRVWQLCMAPFCFGCCRFTPSCSHYAEEALRTKPLPRAIGLIVWRVLRCNPWGSHGLDPVPGTHSTAKVQ